uniref:Receptor expression-enhancing protein n=1 Tax=Angiostrongylus cantonensis TaxID=6313 RepID=A0A0K0DBA7_ANGCA
MFGAAFYIPITIYVVILVGRDLLKPPVKSKREDKMTAFLEQHMLKNGLEVKENIAKVVYGDKFEERKEEITKSLYAGVGKSGEKLRGNHDTIKTLLCGIKSKEPVAMTSSTIPKVVVL